MSIQSVLGHTVVTLGNETPDEVSRVLATALPDAEVATHHTDDTLASVVVSIGRTMHTVHYGDSVVVAPNGLVFIGDDAMVVGRNDLRTDAARVTLGLSVPVSRDSPTSIYPSLTIPCTVFGEATVFALPLWTEVDDYVSEVSTLVRSLVNARRLTAREGDWSSHVMDRANDVSRRYAVLAGDGLIMVDGVRVRRLIEDSDSALVYSGTGVMHEPLGFTYSVSLLTEPWVVDPSYNGDAFVLDDGRRESFAVYHGGLPCLGRSTTALHHAAEAVGLSMSVSYRTPGDDEDTVTAVLSVDDSDPVTVSPGQVVWFTTAGVRGMSVTDYLDYVSGR